MSALSRQPESYNRWHPADKDIAGLENWIQAARGAHDEFVFTANDHVAFAPAQDSPAGWRVALVTTGGVHLRSQPPFDVLNPCGDPTAREIPAATPAGEFLISDTHYDHSDADGDINVMFPIERLNDLVARGVVGSSSPVHFGLMGFAPNPRRDGFVASAQTVARRLRDEGVNVAILTPG